MLLTDPTKPLKKLHQEKLGLLNGLVRQYLLLVWCSGLKMPRKQWRKVAFTDLKSFMNNWMY